MTDQLPAPGSDALSDAIRDIWSSILKLDDIGAEDDFFELGATSMAASHMLAQVRSATGAPVRARDLVEHPRLGMFAARVQAILGPVR